MAEKFLYEELDSLSRFGSLPKEMPLSMTLNLNPSYQLRPYQTEAFARFFFCYKNNFPGKSYPLHFLFNMATGSGKTLIMAGLILYLYEQGYRNFLFFVNSTNIIEKTKDNFLNPQSIKYLFNQLLHFNNRRININAVSTFEGVSPQDINICFTTIQKLHTDLTNQRENALTFEDFKRYKVVLIADEAHHINVSTKSQKELFESWENTVEKIFSQHEDNILLEFTATHNYEIPAMVEKYRHKVLIRYDLLQFRNDQFSKDVVIIQSDFEQRERILQALILNQYKQEVAAKYQINLKPVILFKAQRTIVQSQENKAEFHQLIDTLTSQDITHIRQSNIPLVQKAFRFFDEHLINHNQIVERLKQNFRPEFCLSVNEDKDQERYQILVNTLEDKNNRIRAIFAVQKLNEGWDVLNLFDIVRCYETRDSGRGKIGPTTLSEAQLIGRGARYFPFSLPHNNDRFRRKYDHDMNHELRVLEELHYHSINDSRYIAEIRTALVDQGLLDEQETVREIKLKDSFKKTNVYKFGLIWLNSRRPKEYQHVFSFEDLGVKKRNYIHTIATGSGAATVALTDGRRGSGFQEENREDIKIVAIDRNILQTALACNPFFMFSSLKHYFPHLNSLKEFIASENYLGGLEITFQGDLYELKNNRFEQLTAVQGLLKQIENEIREQAVDFEGSKEFKWHLIHDIFKDKVLKFDPKNIRATQDAQFDHFVSDKDWATFQAIYGTSEEKAFVRMLDRFIQSLQTTYEQIYLLRNEGHFALYNFKDGQAFQPDFVLFLQQKNGEQLIYQLFIEPKGKHLREHDRWKEQFLNQISELFTGRTLKFDDKKYRLVGVPFYNVQDENQFKGILEAVLS